jgi:hypothetical protein
MDSQRVPPNVIDLGEGFWNIRGSLKLGGVLQVGTQASLVRRPNGRFVLLDACPLDAATAAWVDRETDGGEAIDAIVNLHPFHTLSVRAVHERYPGARLYGTVRHHRLFPDLAWEDERTEDAAFHAQLSDDFDFSVPRGVDFVSPNEHLHFSSVLAFHRPSRTLHVDDTLAYVRLPTPVSRFKRDVLRFHPTLSRVLERRPGAAADFRAWAGELVDRSRDVDNLCAAHSAALVGRSYHGAPVSERIEQALHKVDRTLRSHERSHG